MCTKRRPNEAAIQICISTFHLEQPKRHVLIDRKPTSSSHFLCIIFVCPGPLSLLLQDTELIAPLMIATSRERPASRTARSTNMGTDDDSGDEYDYADDADLELLRPTPKLPDAPPTLGDALLPLFDQTEEGSLSDTIDTLFFAE